MIEYIKEWGFVNVPYDVCKACDHSEYESNMKTEPFEIEIFKGVLAKIQTFYQPYEKPEYEYPGCPEEFYIETVMVNGEDIAEYLTESFLDSLLDKIRGTNED